MEQNPLGEPYVHQAELDIARSTHDVELAEAVGKGVDRLERNAETAPERIAGLNRRAREQAGRLFDLIAREVVTPGSTDAVDRITTIMAQGGSLERSHRQRRIPEKYLGLDRADAQDLAYLDATAEARAAKAAGGSKRAGLSRVDQNALAGRARHADARAEQIVVSRRLTKALGAELDELAYRLENPDPRNGA